MLCLGLPSNSAHGHPVQSGLCTRALKACPHPHSRKCSHAFGRRGTTLGKNAGWERTQERSEREVIGSHFKALLPELWSSGGLTGHQLSLTPYHRGTGTEELAFVLGTLQGSRQSLLPSREALSLACLIARPRVQPCRASLL